MKGDFSKDTFDAKKHFHDVLMQQGRVLLDQEWNEQAGIETHRTETGVKDIVGDSGAPVDNAGFEIIPVMMGGSPPAPGKDLQISKGRFYVDGILCENENDILFSAQPDYASTPLPTVVGTYIFYLDVWLRHITALEDASIREVALGGPDTTTRTKTVWQVKYVVASSATTCAAGLPSAVTDPSTGTMNARSEISTSTDDPCVLVTSGGYTRLENQLYRVEIHTAGANRAHSTFKWSRDNGSVIVKWEKQDAANKNNLTASSAGRDDLLGFKTGNWIELINDDNDLLGTPGILVQLLTVNGNVLTIDPATIKDPQNPGAVAVTINPAKNPRIRRWDSLGDIKLNTANSTWLELEDGVEVNFVEGSYKTGDYWLIPARTATADVEWPFTTAQPPNGVKHHYAQLAIANLTAPGGILSWAQPSDCRHLFPPLTELTSLYYAGGDGQEAMPGNALPNTLKVGVANGRLAVSGANVKFEILTGGGTLSPANGLVSTGPNGIAECGWTLGANTPDLKLQVKASLLDTAGNIIADDLPVIFNATFSIAENIAYQSQCSNWVLPAPTTVAQAIDQLCERKNQGGDKCCSIAIGPDGEYKTLAEALAALLKLEQLDVSLCFLPGNHVIDKDIDLSKIETRFRTLHITGVAAYITMTAQKLELLADKIVLEGFSVFTNEAANLNTDPQVVLVAGIVIIDYCAFIRAGASSIPFVYITANKPGSVAYLTNSSFVGFYSLVFANGVQGVIEKNVITILVLQNANLNDFKPIPLGWNDDTKRQMLTNLSQQQGQFVNLTNWVLAIRGNRVGAIITDVNRPFPQDMYQSIFISENVLQLDKGVFISNSFVAQHLSILNNQFLTIPTGIGAVGAVAGNIATGTLAFVVAYQAVIMGNMTISQGAIIDALVINGFLGAQSLNLVGIKV
ncbi:DUF6519 domain-containing protein [Mucilaginibacter agri]|uniref:Uncharacterized protein n=1 Tax=Mucilaginibacter agri TaxID=2695265 RepID=A0A965ZKN1_9SPHI|nr:DUF6519 domain-containing protein [Mucilaginibacter agri]NCD71699.1 hypothetical protein [Mucilaginibacter agri]